jgi:hypothetical protein
MADIDQSAMKQNIILKFRFSSSSFYKYHTIGMVLKSIFGLLTQKCCSTFFEKLISLGNLKISCPFPTIWIKKKNGR